MEAAPQQQAESGQPSGANRRVNGLFQKGVSGNPGGRPKKTPAQRLTEQLTRAQAQAAVEKLMGKALVRVEQALTSDDDQLALRAALDVLDRGLGKPTQRIEGSIAAEQVTVVSPELLQAAARKLLALTTVDAEDAIEADRP